ncbi:MAG: sugar phosphate isomerase/epimerase [Acidobacteria bacterium]|nr:sugar phosphate isomerase/epimerase [Acidobacteriota bacterium]MDA1233286.1 sugar phosphate isomerase/epimerase [Acidobacteriota bacterium]
MQLGFVSAILADQSFEQVIEFAARAGFDCVEVMCWPQGKAERRYAGVTHIDVTDLKKSDATYINDLLKSAGVSISSLGYYPNALSPDRDEAKAAVAHLRKVIRASALLGINKVTAFVGRDFTKSVEGNWARFVKTWTPLIQYAEDRGVWVGIENCPMLFSSDEWPSGKNLAHSPAIWRRMFADIPSKYFGLNYDPSHMIWQQMDEIAPITEFADRIRHVHAKDVRVDWDRLNDVGVLALPPDFHTPKLPGLGDVDWGGFFSALTDAGYNGTVCIEVEDRVYEKTLRARHESLRQSARYLSQFMPFVNLGR